MTPNEFCDLLRILLVQPEMQGLWTVADRGMPVYAHSVDVALLCLDAYPEWRDRFPEFRLDVVVTSAILHDLSKLSARRGQGRSHSHIMTQEPGLAVAEAVTVLENAQAKVGVWFDAEGIDHIWHAIAAHHGRWGKVSPATPEATLLHVCDNLSGMQHRIAPVDANDILPLLSAGYRWTQAGELLGVNRGIVKTRLDDACRAERVRSPAELMERWQERGSVVVGDADRVRQIERARYIVDFARRCPDSLVEAVWAHLPKSARSPGRKLARRTAAEVAVVQAPLPRGEGISRLPPEAFARGPSRRSGRACSEG